VGKEAREGVREAEEKAFVIESEKSERERLRVEVSEELLGVQDRGVYLERQKIAAERLNLSISSIQRLIRVWESSGKERSSFRLFRVLSAFGDFECDRQVVQRDCLVSG
jgi:hypothetical protein